MIWQTNHLLCCKNMDAELFAILRCVTCAFGVRAFWPVSRVRELNIAPSVMNRIGCLWYRWTLTKPTALYSIPVGLKWHSEQGNWLEMESLVIPFFPRLWRLVNRSCRNCGRTLKPMAVCSYCNKEVLYGCAECLLFSNLSLNTHIQCLIQLPPAVVNWNIFWYLHGWEFAISSTSSPTCQKNGAVRQNRDSRI